MSKARIKESIEKLNKKVVEIEKKGEDASTLKERVLPYLTTLKYLEEIREVLKLKGGLSIDYDFITEKKVKNPLVKDNQRMENA